MSSEILSLISQLVVTFFGVFCAFMLDRYIELRKKNQDKKDLLRDLRTELEGIRDKLTGKGNLHFPDIWSLQYQAVKYNYWTQSK